MPRPNRIYIESLGACDETWHCPLILLARDKWFIVSLIAEDTLKRFISYTLVGEKLHILVSLNIAIKRANNYWIIWNPSSAIRRLSKENCRSYHADFYLTVVNCKAVSFQATCLKRGWHRRYIETYSWFIGLCHLQGRVTLSQGTPTLMTTHGHHTCKKKKDVDLFHCRRTFVMVFQSDPAFHDDTHIYIVSPTFC